MSEGQRKVRLAIIGCGGIARAHMRGYEQIKQAEPDKLEIVAVCDSIVERAQESVSYTHLTLPTNREV